MNDLILYTTADQQTVWLTQLEMAELFDATQQNIPLHLKIIVEDRELDVAATVKESLTVPSWSDGHAIAEEDCLVVREHAAGPM